MPTSTVTRGATIMLISVTLAKLLGIVYIVPLTALIGTTGLGIYQNAYALYIILLTLSTTGFPTAMGKLISERLALRRYDEVEQIYRTTMKLVLRIGIGTAIVIWVCAPWYGALVALKGTQSATMISPSVRALSFSLLVVPIMSVYRGYLQGFQQLEANGYSQTVEQLFRVISMLVGAAIIVQVYHGDTDKMESYGAATATLGSFLGALPALVLLANAVKRQRNLVSKGNLRTRFRGVVNGIAAQKSQVQKQLWMIAIPVCAGALVVPFSNLLDSVTIQNLLMFKGLDFKQATEQFGILSRQAFTLLQIPLAFAMAVGTAVLPAVSTAHTVRDKQALRTHILGSLRAMFVLTFPTASVFLILGKPLDVALFGTSSTDTNIGAQIISSVSFMGIFSAFELISTYILQGLGHMSRPVRNMLIGIVVKLILNIFFVFPFGIMGAAVASAIGYGFSSILNVLAVKKYSQVQFSVVSLAGKPVIVSIILAAGMWAMSTFVKSACPPSFGERGISSTQVIVSVFIGGLVYVVGIVKLRIFSHGELIQLPVLGKMLVRLERLFNPAR